MDDGGSQRATGHINGGKYRLDSQNGPEPGKYRVEITWRKKTGNKVPGEGGHPRDEIVPGIPAKYNTESELVVEVKPGRNTFHFDPRSDQKRNPVQQTNTSIVLSLFSAATGELTCYPSHLRNDADWPSR